MSMLKAISTDQPDLVARIADGDSHAFEALMRRYNQRLFRAARSVLRDDDEAQEALQDAYWKAYCGMKEFRAEAALSTWLTRIVINEALMRLRRIRRRDQVIGLCTDGDSERTRVMNTTASASASPDQLAWRAELRVLIEHHLDQLPDNYRTVFLLRAVEEMSTLEIAEVLELPEATVRTRYFRARGLLREALGREIDATARDAFSFAGHRCDQVVEAVLRRLASN